MINMHAKQSSGTKGLKFVLILTYMGEAFRINPEFRILRLTSQRKSASKC